MLPESTKSLEWRSRVRSLSAVCFFGVFALNVSIAPACCFYWEFFSAALCFMFFIRQSWSLECETLHVDGRLKRLTVVPDPSESNPFVGSEDFSPKATGRDCAFSGWCHLFRRFLLQTSSSLCKYVATCFINHVNDFNCCWEDFASFPA